MSEHAAAWGVRRAGPGDAARCQAIYAPYVEQTVISFEEEPPSVEEMGRRMAASLATHDWLVLEGPDGPDTVVGFAYGTTHRARPSYRWACDVSVYVETGRRRTGAGRRLYDALFASLANRGYLTALAGITLPNPDSEGLHRALGFETVGTYRRIGWKHGAWHDVLWLQRPLGEAVAPPPELDNSPGASGPLRPGISHI